MQGTVNYVNTIAMRAMLDRARQKIVESGVIADCRMDTWNSNVDAMTEDQLQQLGLTRAAVNETKFGVGTAQALGFAAAHKLDM